MSLDAPVIAILWQVLLARSLAVNVSRGELLVLGLCVWLVYLADRILDALHPPVEGWEPARKAFYRDHLRAASAAGLTLAVAVPPLTFWLLDRATFFAGLLLTVPLFFYLAATHLTPPTWRACWPREGAIACLFAAGTFLAVRTASQESLYPLTAPTGLFILLCWGNLAAIETWEWQANPRYTEGEPSRSARWIASHLTVFGTAIAGLAAILLYADLCPAVFAVPCCLSGLALAVLARHRLRLPMVSLRVAADLALCTPVLVLLFPAT